MLATADLATNTNLIPLFFDFQGLRMNRTLLSLNLGSNLIGDKWTLKIAEVNNSNFVLLPFILCLLVVIFLLSFKVAEVNDSNLVLSPCVLSLLIAVLLLSEKGTLRIAEANDSNLVLSPCIFNDFHCNLAVVRQTEKWNKASESYHPFQHFGSLFKIRFKVLSLLIHNHQV